MILYRLIYFYLRLKYFFDEESGYKVVVYLSDKQAQIIDTCYCSHWHGYKGFYKTIKMFRDRYSDKKYKYAIVDSSSLFYMVNNKHIVSKSTFEKLFLRKKSLIFKAELKFRFGNIESFEEIVL